MSANIPNCRPGGASSFAMPGGKGSQRGRGTDAPAAHPFRGAWMLAPVTVACWVLVLGLARLVAILAGW